MRDKWSALPDDREVRRATAAAFLGGKPNTMAIWAVKGTGPAFTRTGATRGLCYYKMGDLRAFAKTRNKRSTKR